MKFLLLVLISFNLYAGDLTFFEYTPTIYEPAYELRRENKDVKIFNGSLQLHHKYKNNIISFEYYQLKSEEKKPLVFVFPPIAARIPPVIERTIALKLSKQGFHAVIVNLNEDIVDTTRSILKINDFFINETINFRQVLDKMLSRPEIDRNRVYAAGLSLGGMRASLALAVEPRLRKAYVYVAGGDVAEIMGTSKVRIIEKYKEEKKRELKIVTDQEYINELTKVIKVDPLFYARYRSSKDIFMVLAKNDKQVPYKNQLKLYEAFNRPKARVYRYGHRIVGSFSLFNAKLMSQFFNQP